MDEQTQLKDSILAQAHEKGRKLLEEAKETILKEETAQEERLRSALQLLAGHPSSTYWYARGIPPGAHPLASGPCGHNARLPGCLGHSWSSRA